VSESPGLGVELLTVFVRLIGACCKLVGVAVGV
jgi:hypothetical protein